METIKSILSTPDITYAKWDCNRYLTQPGSSYLAPDRQSELWIDYVHALYVFMDKTAKTFPDTELMLCSGGGGRVDYGALKYFDEFWPSDNTDPVVRVLMQWDYSYFFPPMALASHVTLSGNRPMHFACSVAMSACFGMDLDLTKLPAQDKAILAGAIAAYKQIRDVIGNRRFVPAGGSASGISGRAEFCVTRPFPRRGVCVPVEGWAKCSGVSARTGPGQALHDSRVESRAGPRGDAAGRQNVHG